VLGSNDVTLLESSVTTFTTFTAHYDSATISADQGHSRQFDGILQTYTSFASKHKVNSNHGKAIPSVPLAIRYRTAGLLAIQGLVTADAFGSDNGNLLKTLMPVILENLYSAVPGYLSLLQYRENSNEQYEKEQLYKRRQSMNAPRNTIDSGQADPSTATGTTAYVDQRAEEEVGVLALRSLKQIFGADNRSQIRTGTTAILNFATTHSSPISRTKLAAGEQSVQATWCADLFELICRKAPVQDRFVILVTAMENLIQSPIVEEDVERQLVLTGIIGKLLRSSINFIGLSVMDVLIGLIQHVLLLLQLGGQNSSVQPHYQQADGVLAEKQGDDKPGASSSTSVMNGSVVMEVVNSPSAARVELLEQLQVCIGDLATHVYYSDQIGDMISALLLRLKPLPVSGVATSYMAIADPGRTADAIANSVRLQEKPHTDGFFSFDTARLTALRAVKEILVVANSRRADGNNRVSRSPVKISVWEGTQWLLRDVDVRVRQAYVDAFLTWLELEVDQGSFRLADEHALSPRSTRKDVAEVPGAVFAKRALSDASQRSRGRARVHYTFLQLLHLAVYENALQFAESELDMLQIHLLLTRLTQKLGLNSVRTALPMVFRLQEDVSLVAKPAAKVSIGSIVYGYLWALIATFNCATSEVGREISGEIDRRSRHGLWLKTVRVPPLPLEKFQLPGKSARTLTLGVSVVHTGSLKPFQYRAELVACIADAYVESVLPQPSSPPTSPGRRFSVAGIKSAGDSIPHPAAEKALPPKVKQEMLAEWTKETCIATVQNESAKTASLSGSKTGSSTGHRHLLAVANEASAESDPFFPGSGQRPFEVRPYSGAYGLIGAGYGSMQLEQRRASPGSSRTPQSTSSTLAVIRINELKQVLAGNYTLNLPPAARYSEASNGTGTNSMVSASVSSSTSETSLPGVAVAAGPDQSISTKDAKHQRSSRPLQDDHRYQNGEVPPVLPLPTRLAAYGPISIFNDAGESQPAPSDPRTSEDINKRHSRRGRNSTGSDGLDAWGRTTGGKVDLRELLNGIETAPRRPTTAIGQPPY